MPIYHAKEFFKSIRTEALFLDCFFQKFEQLFPNRETFFQKNVWLKSLQMVGSLTGLMCSEIRQP